MSALCGGIEAGGTKFVCALGTGPDDIREEARLPTATPEETLGQTVAFFRRYAEPDAESGSGIAAVGIASFGPVDLHPDSPTYGHITATPKTGWSNVDLAGRVGRSLGLPVGFDTDVNGAALGERRWGAAQGLENFIYMTIGTGIGGGGMVNGRLMHGLVHPEMGHVRIPHNLEADPYPGRCPFHRDCLEGLAAGPAMEERWGISAESLPEDHPAWRLEARYLAFALVNFICTLSPQRIILGGGVMNQPHLFPMVRLEVLSLLNDYVRAPAILEGIDDYIVPPGLGARAGVLGAIALAQEAVGAWSGR